MRIATFWKIYLCKTVEVKWTVLEIFTMDDECILVYEDMKYKIEDLWHRLLKDGYLDVTKLNHRVFENN